MAGWVHGRIYYYPYQNNAETMPSEGKSSRNHPVHTFDMTQQASAMQSASRSQDADDTDSLGQQSDLASFSPFSQYEICSACLHVWQTSIAKMWVSADETPHAFPAPLFEVRTVLPELLLPAD